MFKVFRNREFKGKYIFFIYIICALINIAGESLKIGSLIFFSKPLLMILLLLFFLFNINKNISKKIVLWMVIAIISANSGDILLLFTDMPQHGELFFLAGLGSFFLTHIAYSFSFSLLSRKKKYEFPLILMLPLLLFWFGFNLAFSSNLSGFLKPAVILYSSIILMMIYFAWHLKNSIDLNPTRWIWWGALLFLFSDSCIGVNKFGQDLFIIPAVNVLIMATYIAGQGLIVIGVTSLINLRVLPSE